jgi:hypothetical protein
VKGVIDLLARIAPCLGAAQGHQAGHVLAQDGFLSLGA